MIKKIEKTTLETDIYDHYRVTFSNGIVISDVCVDKDCKDLEEKLLDLEKKITKKLLERSQSKNVYRLVYHETTK